jgi:hypothetical protein
MKKTLLPLFALMGIGAADTPDTPAPPPNGEMGFVLNAFAPAIYQDKGDCPQGLSNTVRENYLAGLAPPERARLSLPENEALLAANWKASARGPNHTNLCANPEAFPTRGPQKIYQGKVAHGLDLDDGNPECSNNSFTSPTGETGIDNQAYRALGCWGNYRGVDGVAGDVVKGWNMRLASGEQSIVMLLRGVDSLENDDSVEIIIASTNDRPVLDSRGNFVSGASFSLTGNPAWRNPMRGRIVKGVLTASAPNVTLDSKFGHGGQMGATAQFEFHAARMRLAFLPDGTVKGLFGAYQTPHNIMKSSIAGGLGAATVAGIDCAAEYNTLMKLADRARDPKTGQCTQVSMAYDLAAVPAFVFDAPQNMAEAGKARK